MKKMTPDRVASIIRLIMLVLSLWTGSAAVKEGSIVASTPQGVAGATSDEASFIGGNALVSLVCGLLFARPNRVADVLTNWFGIDGATTASTYASILNLHKQYLKTKDSKIRDHYREAALLLVDELFKNEGKVQE